MPGIADKAHCKLDWIDSWFAGLQIAQFVLRSDMQQQLIETWKMEIVAVEAGGGRIAGREEGQLREKPYSENALLAVEPYWIADLSLVAAAATDDADIADLWS